MVMPTRDNKAGAQAAADIRQEHMAQQQVQRKLMQAIEIETQVVSDDFNGKWPARLGKSKPPSAISVPNLPHTRIPVMPFT